MNNKKQTVQSKTYCFDNYMDCDVRTVEEIIECQRNQYLTIFIKKVLKQIRCFTMTTSTAYTVLKKKRQKIHKSFLEWQTYNVNSFFILFYLSPSHVY